MTIVFEPFAIPAMTMVSAFLFLVLSFLWSSKGLTDALIKVTFVVMSVWCGLNSIGFIF